MDSGSGGKMNVQHNTQPSTRIRRMLITRIMRSVVLHTSLGEFPPHMVSEYRHELQGMTMSDLAREYKALPFHDYPVAQDYIVRGGMTLRFKALRTLTGAAQQHN